MKLINRTGKKYVTRRVVYLLLISFGFGCITTGNTLSEQTSGKETHRSSSSTNDLKTNRTTFINASSGSGGHITILK